VFGHPVAAMSPWGVVLSIVEQRLDAVRAVPAGAQVTEVAANIGVSRQIADPAVHVERSIVAEPSAARTFCPCLYPAESFAHTIGEIDTRSGVA
jgi:hypothetical protein